MLFAMPQVPECRASMRVYNQDKDAAMGGVLLVSIVPEGARQLTMLMSGSFLMVIHVMWSIAPWK